MAYRLLDEQESTLGTLGRGVARTAARIGEGIAGTPADIVSGLAGLGNLATQTITGQELPGARAVSELVQPITSQGLKKNITERLTGDYLKPQGQGEAFVDQIMQDLGGLLLGNVSGAARAGGTTLVKAGAQGIAQSATKNIAKAVGKQALRAGAANVAGKLAEDMFDSPQLGGAVKGLTLLASGTAGTRDALKNLQKESYQAAKQSIPAGAQIPVRTLGKQLDNTIKAVSKLDMPEKDFVIDRLRAVRRNITSGRMGAMEAFELRKNMNDYLYNYKLNPQQARYVNKIRDLLNESLDQYGNLNPNFKNALDIGDDITRGLKAGGDIQRWLNDNINVNKIMQNYKPLSYGAYGLYTLLGKPYTTGALAFGVPSAFATKYLGQTYNLIKNSPVAYNYYKQAAQAALKKDAVAFAKAVKKFDQFVAQQDQNTDQANSMQGQRYQLLS